MEATLDQLSVGQKSARFARMFAAHLWRWLPVYLLLGCGLQWFGEHCRLAFNRSASLPHSVYVVRLGEPLSRGDYGTFAIGKSRPAFPEQVKFTKLVVGVPGDVIAVRQRTVLVNGVPVGQALFRSANWPSLSPVQPGVIPAGHYFIMGLHKDSLDSRYSVVGLMTDDELVGRAHPVW